MRSTISLCALLLGTGTVMGDDKKDATTSAVRPLDVKAEGPAAGKATAPVTIVSAAELEKALGDGATAKAVKKLVKFETEKVVYFAWSGSGQDRITHTVVMGKKGPEVTFTYAQGRTRDFRPHHKFFALPKDAPFKVVSGDR
jgi:hypothetical protein